MTSRLLFSLLVWLTSLLPLCAAHPLTHARWIAFEPQKVTTVPLIHAPFIKRTAEADSIGRYTMPMFRKTFSTNKKVKHATLYVCGLGQFVAHLDDQPVGHHFLDPGWTLYNKEAEYVAFDVTDRFTTRRKQPSHTLCVSLGGGFYNIPRGRYNKLMGSYGVPKLRLSLQIEYAHGEKEEIATDATWETSPSPITYSSIYGGEDVDLRLQPAWQPALVLPQDEALVLHAQAGTAVVVDSVFTAVSHHTTPAGHLVFDFGQNMSGIPCLSLAHCKAGAQVSCLPAELMKDDGSVYNKPVGNWQYVVTLCDTARLTLRPQFSYTGFRYVEVRGAVLEGDANPEGLPVITAIHALHTTSECTTHETGTFSCDNALLNDIHHLVDWAIRSNLQSVLTDCPHREKLGWLEQDHLMMPSLYYRYAVQPLYAKMMRDIAASQFTAADSLGLAASTTPWIAEQHDLTGMIPTIAPYYTRFGWNFDDTPEWGSTFIISPWYHYQWTGDASLFTTHFEAMQRYIDYLTRRARKNGYLLTYGLGDWYDLGPKKPGYAQLTSDGLTATATFYYDLVLMAHMATRLHRPDVAATYYALSDSVKTAYNARFFHPSEGYYDRDSQCANAISCYMGLVPEGSEETVRQHLAADIEGRLYAIDHHTDTYEWGDNGPTVITAGDVGFRYVLVTLAEAGRHNLIWRMINRNDVPGYGLQLRKGATTLTESWQALEKVSNNHLMLGHILEWMYGYVGGLRRSTDDIGWTHLLIDPHPVEGVNRCSVSYLTPHGRVSAAWQCHDGKVDVQYHAPAGLQITVCATGTVTRL